MPYTTNVTGTTITAAWANANIRDQVVTPFATTTARDSAITSPVSGMLATITGASRLVAYQGSAWIELVNMSTSDTWTPTVTQSGSVTVTVSSANYFRIGRMIQFQAVLAVTGSGTSANPVRLSLPVPAAARYGTAAIPIGNAIIQDTTGATKDYSGPLCSVSTSLCDISASSPTGSAGTNDRLGQAGFTAALASGDAIEYCGWYEAAA